MADVALLSRDDLARLLVDAAEAGARRVLAERAASDDLLDVGEVARRLGISVRAVRHYLASGALVACELPATSETGTGKRRIVRVRSSAVAALVARCERRDEPAGDVLDLAVERAARKVVG